MYIWTKKHTIYLKSQIFLFFSEALPMSSFINDKAPEKKRNICDFK